MLRIETVLGAFADKPARKVVARSATAGDVRTPGLAVEISYG